LDRLCCKKEADLLIVCHTSFATPSGSTLVLLFSKEGYSSLSLMRASAVVKRQLTVVAAATRHLVFEFLGGCHAAREALASQGSTFDLGHVQPTAMQRRVMDLQFGRQATRLGGREGLIQSGRGMGRQIIHHQDDLLGRGRMDIDHLLHEMRPISAGFLLAHLDHTFASQGFASQKEVEQGSLLVNYKIGCRSFLTIR
jgi:hypothetical protein